MHLLRRKIFSFVPMKHNSISYSIFFLFNRKKQVQILSSSSSLLRLPSSCATTRTAFAFPITSSFELHCRHEIAIIAIMLIVIMLTILIVLIVIMSIVIIASMLIILIVIIITMLIIPLSSSSSSLSQASLQ